MNKEDRERLEIIEGHLIKGGYMYDHVRADISFLVSVIKKQELKLSHERWSSYREKLDSGV